MAERRFSKCIMLKFIRSLFKTPTFQAGVRVNRFHQGSIDRVDGRVVAQTAQGVLVEWPRFGSGWERPQNLCEQA
jgi:hypothetical protein